MNYNSDSSDTSSFVLLQITIVTKMSMRMFRKPMVNHVNKCRVIRTREAKINLLTKKILTIRRLLPSAGDYHEKMCTGMFQLAKYSNQVNNLRDKLISRMDDSVAKSGERIKERDRSKEASFVQQQSLLISSTLIAANFQDSLYVQPP